MEKTSNLSTKFHIVVYHDSPSFVISLYASHGALKTISCFLVQLQIGRPVVFSLAADGEAGVRKVLQMLRDEFELTMALSGCRSLKEISRHHIVTDWDAPRVAPRL